jgi:hypothetical protein
MQRALSPGAFAHCRARAEEARGLQEAGAASRRVRARRPPASCRFHLLFFFLFRAVQTNMLKKSCLKKYLDNFVEKI